MIYLWLQFSSIQLLGCVRFFVTPWTAAHHASLFITSSQSLPKLMSIESVMPSNHLILCRPLLPQPSIFPSIRIFSNESALRSRWPKDWSFSFSISPSSEYSGLISFRVDWLDLLSVQRTFKILLQHHSSKALVVQCSAFFIVQLSHPYMTTRKIKALTRQTFVDKVMSLLFNMLSRWVITFLTRSKCLLISWMQSPSAVYNWGTRFWSNLYLKIKNFRSCTKTSIGPCLWRCKLEFPLFLNFHVTLNFCDLNKVSFNLRRIFTMKDHRVSKFVPGPDFNLQYCA